MILITKRALKVFFFCRVFQAKLTAIEVSTDVPQASALLGRYVKIEKFQTNLKN